MTENSVFNRRVVGAYREKSASRLFALDDVSLCKLPVSEKPLADVFVASETVRAGPVKNRLLLFPDFFKRRFQKRLHEVRIVKCGKTLSRKHIKVFEGRFRRSERKPYLFVFHFGFPFIETPVYDKHIIPRYMVDTSAEKSQGDFHRDVDGFAV